MTNSSTLNPWAEMPAVRWLFALLSGIGFYILFIVYDRVSPALLIATAIVTAIVLFVFLLFVFIKKPSFQYRFRIIKGLFFYLLIACVGFWLSYFHTAVFYQNHFSGKIYPNHTIIAIINDPPVIKEKTVVAELMVTAITINGKTIETSGKIIANLMPDSNSIVLRYGDKICFNDTPTFIEPPKNPNEFDYKSYQQFHNINHRIYLKSGYWQLLSHDNSNWLLSDIYNLRQRLHDILFEVIPGRDERAVATALLLGERGYMTADVMQAFSSSGAIHVLSVSGLHVGVVFLTFNFLLGWMEKTKRGRILKAIIIISIIGFYAIITGLSPSVLRSFVMFSILTISKTINRSSNTYNVLAGSCLLLLLYNPFLITEVGFRLSYLAVLGIVFLYPYIYGLLYVKNKWLNWAWGITAISLSAQIATFPLSLLYFHQFPNLFLLSNLIIIPASNFILCVGMLLFVLSPIPLLKVWIGKMLNLLLVLLNKIVFFFDSLPYSITEGISISHFDMLWWYVLIVAICWYIYNKSQWAVRISTFAIMVLCLSYIYDKIDDINHNQFIVYAAKNKSGWMLKNGNTAYYKMDSSLLYNPSAFKFHVQHHWWDIGIENKVNIDSAQSFPISYFPFGYLVSFDGHKILFVNQNFGKLTDTFPKKIKVDYVVLENNPKVYLSELNKAIAYQKIIFDGSAKEWRKKYWRADCDSLHIPYYDVEKFAFIEEW